MWTPTRRRGRALLVLLAAGCASSSAPLSPVAAADHAPEPLQLHGDEGDDAPTAPEDTAPVVVANPEPEPGSDVCNPYVAPLERRAGALLVNAPPAAPTHEHFGRLRSHVEGSLSARGQRVWVGPQVPGFVPLLEGTAELFLLEEDGDLFVAVYRDPYGTGSCTLSSATNCETFIKGFQRCGEELWTRRLDDFMSRPDRLEVQDLRVVDGIVYFNEACQSYSREAKGRCSALVAIDAHAGELLWRSKHLVSNNRFIVHGDYIVAGYGFTAEPDHLHVVRRRDGKVVQRLRVPKAHENLRLVEDDRLEVVLYPGEIRHFRLRDWTSASPKLEPEPVPGPIRR